MATPEQVIEEKRLTRYIERERLTGIMSDSKWERLLAALRPLEGILDFRRKDVREADDPESGWCREIDYMLAGWRSIEWLDIRAVYERPRGPLARREKVDRSDDFLAALRSSGVPFTRSDDVVRVWGYVRPGVSPRWAD